MKLEKELKFKDTIVEGGKGWGGRGAHGSAIRLVPKGVSKAEAITLHNKCESREDCLRLVICAVIMEFEVGSNVFKSIIDFDAGIHCHDVASEEAAALKNGLAIHSVEIFFESIRTR